MLPDYALKNCWYLCELEENIVAEDAVEPDWSRVPEAKREMVKARWVESNTTKTVTRTNMWGPQIAWFMRFYRITVLGESA